MRGAITELGLGVRFAFAPRTGARLRTLLTIGGVALGVSVMLIAASVPHVLSARDHRADARQPVYGGGRGTLRLQPANTTYHGIAITGSSVQPAAANAPVPPGLTRLPGPGQLAVSPRLAALLRSPGGAELRRRLRARVTETIAPSGLSGPADMRFYRGSDQLSARGLLPDVIRFGGPTARSRQSVVVTLLVVVVFVALLLPVAVFLTTAARFGSEERDRRLSALRLVGTDLAATARVIAGESLVAAVAGLVLGAGLFFAARAEAGHVRIAGVQAFTADVSPAPVLAALVVVLVPLGALIAAFSGIRAVAIEPLGVTRRARRPRRRLIWRLVAPALGFLLLLAFLRSGRSHLSSAAGQVQAAAGIVLVLVGLTAVLPWLTEGFVRRAPDGPLPWLLAIRRLRSEEATTGRVVGAIALTVAGAIALQMLFSAAQSDLSSAPAVVPIGMSARQVTFNAPTRAAAHADVLSLAVAGGGVVAQTPDINPEGRTGFAVEVLLGVMTRHGNALDRLSDRAAQIDPLATVDDPFSTTEAGTLTNLRHTLVFGAVIVLSMIGLSLLVALAEQLREGRRALAVLAAVGTRRSTAAWSVLCQTAIPVVAGLGLAIGLGIALGVVLAAIVHLSPAYDWGAIAALAGAGAAVVAGVTSLSLPALMRTMSPEALRTE